MPRIIVMTMLIFFSLVGRAQSNILPISPVLNNVIYETQVEQWVTTQTAVVTVNIFATLKEDQLASIHAAILKKLNKLANTSWHITQFTRAQNESGLEQVVVQAQARLPENALSNLRTQAKKISEPGETFSLQNIVFDPTLAEIEAVRVQLRHQIYQRVQEELIQLNKIYPNQHFIVHNIRFSESEESPQPRLKLLRAASTSENISSAPLTISNKLVLAASVDLVSIQQ